MLVTLLVIAILVLLVKQSRLSRRVLNLERDVARLAQAANVAEAEARPAPNVASSPEPAAAVVQTPAAIEPMPSVQQSAPATSAKSPTGEHLVGAGLSSGATALWTLLRRNLFAVSGIGLLLLGFALLLGSISWGQLLTPTARIGLVLGVALGLGTLGVTLSGRQPLWAQLVQGGAAALGYLGVYVAVASYGLLSTSVALASFSAIAGWTVWRALREDSKPLAAIGFLGAYAAPLLALNDQASLGLHLGFGLVVTVASLWVGYRRRWVEVASQAYLCVVALAALVFSRSHEPLAFVWQQAYLHAYAFAFGLCAVKWLRDPGCRPNDRAIAVAWLGITAGGYLALQYWLLEQGAFTWAMLGIAAALAAAAWQVRLQAPRVLGETVWIFAALYAACAVAGADVGHALKGLGLLAEGLLLLLTVGAAPSTVRVGLGRAFLAAAAILVLPVAGNAEASVWAIAVLLLASLAGSLVLSQRKRELDSSILSALAGFSVLGAASVLAARHLGPDLVDSPENRTALFALLCLGISGLVSAACAAVTAYRGPWKESLPLQGMPAVFWLATVFLTSPALAAWQVLVLAVTLVAAVVGIQLIGKRPREASAGLTGELRALGYLLVLLMPGIGAYKLLDRHGFWIQPLALSLLLLGLATYALVLSSDPVQLRRRLNVAPARIDKMVDRMLLPGALLCLVPHQDYMRGGLELTGLAVAAALAVWVLSADARKKGPVMVVAGMTAALAAVVLAYAWPHAVSDKAWEQVADSVALAVAWAAVAVGMLFLASKRGDRTMWQFSAAGCVLALMALAVAAGSWGFSVLGGSVALIGIGALFLLAGYLAPMPPAGEPTSAVAR